MRIFLFLILLFPFAALAETDSALDAFLTAPPNPLDLSILSDEAAEKTTVIGRRAARSNSGTRQGILSC